MKSLSPQLLAFLESREAFHRADLFLIELLNGKNITATTAQVPITLVDPASSPPVATIYHPSKFGAWERGPVKTAVSYQPKSEEMSLSVMADSTILIPVAALTSPAVALSLSVLGAVRAGLFDAATVSVYTIYWGLDDPPSEGVKMGFLTTFIGKISSATQTGRSKATFKVADLLYLLHFPVPRNIIQSSCRHTLYDAGCTLLKANFKLANSAAAASDTFYLNLTTDVSTASFNNTNMTFEQGMIKFTGGQNNGLQYTIKKQITNTRIQLMVPLKFPIAVGDTFDMFAGCNKTITACDKQFNNLIHIGAMPFIPNPEIAI